MYDQYPAAQQYSPAQQYRAALMHETVALRGSAAVLQAALVLSLGVNALVIWAVAGQRSIVQRILNGARTISLADANAADDHAHSAWLVSLIAYGITAILFCVWFWRVRRNAGVFSPYAQRRAQPWAFWGWLCPIVSLWFPAQIALDAARSTPGDKRGAVALIRVWWAMFLLDVILVQVLVRQNPSTVHDLLTHTNLAIASQLVQAIAAICALLVVRRLTRDNDDFRASGFPMSAPVG